VFVSRAPLTKKNYGLFSTEIELNSTYKLLGVLFFKREKVNQENQSWRRKRGKKKEKHEFLKRKTLLGVMYAPRKKENLLFNTNETKLHKDVHDLLVCKIKVIHVRAVGCFAIFRFGS